MKPENVVVENLLVGQKILADGYTIFFGNRNCSLEMLYSIIPKPIAFLKQTHSTLLVESNYNSLLNESKPEADAHYCKDDRLAIGIITADCIPLLGYDKHTDAIFALHAGWRGLANQIISKSLSTIHQYLTVKTNFFIGPHIQKNSFEVDSDVVDAFHKIGYVDQKYVCHSPKNDSKFIIDLNLVAHKEIYTSHPVSNIWNSGIDTFIDNTYFSWRRERRTGLRNYSVIFKN